MDVGSLYTGIGGFDLGFERAGMTIAWQCENNKQCQDLLKSHWPKVTLFKDITDDNNYSPIELICGGDPCPIRSKAKSIWKTKIPDLSGYFLAVVGKMRPRWVVRENVPASDDVNFIACLEMLGYRTVIISANAAKVTAQNRERDFIVGCHKELYSSFIKAIPVCKDGKRYAETKYQKTPTYPILTTHSCRWDARDGYIWDGSGIRVANSEERRRFTGFPFGWFGNLSKTAIARMTGNAVVVPIAKIIGELIIKANNHENTSGKASETRISPDPYPITEI